MKTIFLPIMVISLVISSLYCQVKETNKDIRDEALKNAFKETQALFIENKGQIKDTEGKGVPGVLFYCNLQGVTIYFMKDRVSYVLVKSPERKEKSDEEAKPIMLRYDVIFKEANPDVKVVGNDMVDTYFNYFIKGESYTRVRGYKKLVYQNIYPNIDIYFEQKEQGMKYDVIVKPKGKAEDIKFEYVGIKNLEVKSEGQELVVSTEFGDIVEKIPKTYQISKNTQGSNTEETVVCKWKGYGERTIGFELLGYDTTREIVIDPILTWSTYLGGQNNEWVGIAVDEPFQDNASEFPFAGGGIAIDSSEILQSGNIVVTGTTNSPLFPANLGTYSGDYDAFVFKLTPDGFDRVWGLFIGGEAKDCGIDVCVDTANNIYVVGLTRSTGLATESAYQRNCWSCPNYSDMFIAKIEPDGDLVALTYFGGEGSDIPHRIRFRNFPSNYYDGYGVIVVGESNSCDTNFRSRFVGSLPGPVLRTTCISCPELPDAIILRFSNNLDNLGKATFYGGNGKDNALGLFISENNRIFTVGFTTSAESLLISAYPEQPLINRGQNPVNSDGFICEVTPMLGLVYDSYIGGKDNDFATGIDGIRTMGDDYLLIVGFTKSGQNEYFDPINPINPRGNIYDNGAGSDLGDAFVTSLMKRDTIVPENIIYRTIWREYLGGDNIDRANDVFRLKQLPTHFAITGYTKSNDFYLKNAYQNSINNNNLETNTDAFAVFFHMNFPILWSTYFGGGHDEYGIGIVSKNNGNTTIYGINYGGGIEITPETGGLPGCPSCGGTTYKGGTTDAFLANFANRSRGATYFGGPGADQANGIHINKLDGSIYITGSTQSDVFPAVWGISGTYAGEGDAFILKLNENFYPLFCTYFGGEGNDYGNAIYCEGLGDVFVCGTTNSNNGIAYSSQGYYCPQPQKIENGYNAFLLRLSPTGDNIRYATYWGGNGSGSTDIVADQDGNAYIVGYTGDNLYVTPGAYQPIYNDTGRSDGFISSLYNNGYVRWSTYIGTIDDDVVTGVAQTQNSVVLVGHRRSGDNLNDPGLTLVNPWKSAPSKVFIADFYKSNGNARYVSYYGNYASYISTSKIAIDNYGGTPSLYIGVNTVEFADSTINSYRNGQNGILCKLILNNYNQWQPFSARYIGGNNNDFITDIAAYQGKVFVTGYTLSPFNSSDSLAVNAVQSNLAGGSDAFVTKLDANLANIEFSTYYGTSQTDQGLGVDVSSILDYTDFSPVVVGSTEGNQLPGRNQYYSIQYDYGGGGDAFIVKFYGGGGSYAKPVVEEEPIVYKNNTGELILYPNPAFEQIKVDYSFEGEANVHLQICNILGEILFAFEDRNVKGRLTKNITISSLSSGTYFIRIIQNGNVSYYPFLKY